MDITATRKRRFKVRLLREFQFRVLAGSNGPEWDSLWHQEYQEFGDIEIRPLIFASPLATADFAGEPLPNCVSVDDEISREIADFIRLAWALRWSTGGWGGRWRDESLNRSARQKLRLMLSMLRFAWIQAEIGKMEAARDMFVVAHRCLREAMLPVLLLAGGKQIDRDDAARRGAENGRKSALARVKLSDSEALRLWGAGFSLKEIASRYSVSTRTVSRKLERARSGNEEK